MLKHLIGISLFIIMIALGYSYLLKSKFKPLSKCSIDMFDVKTTINNDTWNNIKNGEKRIELFEKETNLTRSIGYINYRTYVGQIGLLFITDDKYISRGLGTQLLNIAIEDMKKVGTKEVWAVTSEGHRFWSKHLNFTRRDPAHKSVTGYGYYKEI